MVKNLPTFEDGVASAVAHLPSAVWPLTAVRPLMALPLTAVTRHTVAEEATEVACNTACIPWTDGR